METIDHDFNDTYISCLELYQGTLVESLLKSYPDDQFGFSVSHTTRKPRDGEINGLHYNFTSVEEMKKDIDSGKFIEYAAVHGNFYGTR